MKKKLILIISSILISLVIISPLFKVSASELPAYYRTKTVPKVKNQGTEGLCWAFAVTSTLETELIKNNNVDKNIDFSELALAYFCYNVAYDKLGQFVSANPTSTDYLDGASDWFAAARLSSGVSPIDEDKIPYSYKDEDVKIDRELGYTDSYHLKESSYLYSPSNTEIKKAIQKYGAVTAGFSTYNEPKYFNYDTNAWYNDSNEDIASHAISIIGWDDNYSKKNFNSSPKSNGAWIVKNSWGEEWGDKGFFYLSYEDTSLSDTVVTFDMEPGAASDNLYQNTFSHCFYFTGDGTLLNGPQYHEYQANVYTAKANPQGGEQLESVGFETFQPGKYEIKIYTNLKDISDPTSGTLSDTLSGKLTYAGYYIFDLKKPIYLSEGESFSIVVKLVAPDGTFLGVATGGSNYNYCVTYGQSYLLGYLGEDWIDYAGYYGENFAIKAYTNNCKKDVSNDSKMIYAKAPDLSDINSADTVKNVTMNFANDSTAIISWDKDSSYTYFVYKYDYVSRTWSYLDLTHDNTYEITGLKANTKYKFGVKEYKKAIVGNGYVNAETASKNIAEVEFTTAKSLGASLSLQKTNKGYNLSWTKQNNANLYEIYRLGPENDYAWQKIKTIKNTTTFTDTTALKGVTYLYRVYSYKNKKLLSKGSVLVVK